MAQMEIVWKIKSPIYLHCFSIRSPTVTTRHTTSTTTRAMERPLPPRESGLFVAARSQDVFVEEEGVRRAAEMLYALRHSEELTASGWKKANPLAPRDTVDQGSLSASLP